jgi:3'(2'), 5'-bisphosphate nucleotidase
MLRSRLASVFFTLASQSPHMSTPTTFTTPKVNLLDLASACVACTEAASKAIQKIAQPDEKDSQKNTRLKEDGSFVTDADFAAQGIIVQAVRSVSEYVRIVGEESAEEMAAHIGKHGFLEDAVLKRTQQEIRLRYHHKQVETLPLAQGVSATDGHSSDAAIAELLKGLVDPDECVVEASRVGVIVDPLDGTKAYAHGEYDAVSILICIILDNQPYFGVIGKPFGYLEGAHLTSMLDTSCVTIYGGPLLKGVYIAGGKTIEASPIAAEKEEDFPRAVISGSRSKGVVHDFCLHLAKYNLIHKEPLLISGAGEKSLRLILQINNEALWFFPKSGTSLWDVAAPDALLRSLGGKLTDKFGHEMDYSKARADAENMEGVVACIDADLHAKCIELFNEGDWANRR